MCQTNFKFFSAFNVSCDQIQFSCSRNQHLSNHSAGTGYGCHNFWKKITRLEANISIIINQFVSKSCILTVLNMIRIAGFSIKVDMRLAVIKGRKNKVFPNFVLCLAVTNGWKMEARLH